MSVRLPRPLPDETWQSVMAAHQRGWSTPARWRIAERSLGSARAPVAYDHPRGLQHTVERLPRELGLAPEGVLLAHTLLPLHRPFLTPHRWMSVKASALANRHLQFLLGVGPSRITLPRWLRLCPKCVVSDRRMWGRAYWHRVHQVPGAWVCPTHGVPLWETNVRAHRDAAFELVSVEDAKLVYPIRFSKAEHGLLRGIATDLAALLDPDCPAPGPDQLQAAYFSELQTRGFITHQGRVKNTELCRRFQRYYGNRLLARLGCSVNATRRDHWLARLVHPPRWHSAPLRHVLFIRFLGHDAESFLGRALAQHRITTDRLVMRRAPCSHCVERGQILQRRHNWLRICRTESGNLRERHDALYSWLWRNDRDWLHARRRKPTGPHRTNCRRPSLDRILAAEVRNAARIALKENPAARLSRRRIAERTSRQFLVQGNSPALPATMAAIRQVVESVDACAIRRLLSAARTLPPTQKRIRWRLIAHAGLGATVVKRNAVRRVLAVLTKSSRT